MWPKMAFDCTEGQKLNIIFLGIFKKNFDAILELTLLNMKFIIFFGVLRG